MNSEKIKLIKKKKRRRNFRRRKQITDNTFDLKEDDREKEEDNIEMFTNLALKFSLGVDDVSKLYEKFQEENPSGLISREDFLDKEQVHTYIDISIYCLKRTTG